MTEIETFLNEISESNSVPKWVKIKAKLILENKSISNKTFLTGEEMLKLSLEYFGVNDDIFIKKNRKRIVVEKKHLIRYGLYVNGISFENIAKLINCDRTTTYNSLKYIRDVSSVDFGFRNEVDDFLNYLEVNKIK